YKRILEVIDHPRQFVTTKVCIPSLWFIALGASLQYALTIWLGLALAIWAAATIPAVTGAAPEEHGWSALFNGEDLTGWKNPFDPGEAEVVDGETRLTADKKFFLVTEEIFGDFVFTGEVRLPEGKSNSGFMFRCHVEPNNVYGYQAECDGSDRRWSGGLYDEGRRGWIWPSSTGRTKEEKFLAYEEESKAFFAKPEVAGALVRNGWNKYEITCRGNRITIVVNGVTTTEIKDDTDAEGHIAIQHHGEKGQVYRFRNLYLKKL
ncbi:MAG: DUF1080 domain-containing protein, partial [Verrucomicrobiales bacterium]